METAAIRIRSYHPLLLPAVLQTDGYAAAVHSQHPAATRDRVARRVALHRRHRAQLQSRQAELHAVIEEPVLHQPAAARHGWTSPPPTPRCTIQVVPVTADLHPARAAGAFTILDFADVTDGVPLPTTVYRPGIDGAIHLDDTETVELYLDIWASLVLAASPPPREGVRRA